MPASRAPPVSQSVQVNCYRQAIIPHWFHLSNAPQSWRGRSMFEDVKALGKLRDGLFQTLQINSRKLFLVFLCSYWHIHRELQPSRLVASAQLELWVCIKMQIGSLNSNEPCVFQPHQSQDYLPRNLLRASPATPPAPECGALRKTLFSTQPPIKTERQSPLSPSPLAARLCQKY